MLTVIVPRLEYHVFLFKVAAPHQIAIHLLGTYTSSLTFLTFSRRLLKACYSFLCWKSDVLCCDSPLKFLLKKKRKWDSSDITDHFLFLTAHESSFRWPILKPCLRRARHQSVACPKPLDSLGRRSSWGEVPPRAVPQGGSELAHGVGGRGSSQMVEAAPRSWRLRCRLPCCIGITHPFLSPES